MENILVIKSSVDYIFQNLLDGIVNENKDVYCLIQSSRKAEYEMKYPWIRFIDCKKEGFYDIPNEVLDELGKRSYKKIYIPTTGLVAHNFGNIVEVIKRLDYERLIFFHSETEQQEIFKMSKWKSLFYKICIDFFEKIYR